MYVVPDTAGAVAVLTGRNGYTVRPAAVTTSDEMSRGVVRRTGRRGAAPPAPVVVSGPVTIDVAAREVDVAGVRARLSGREASLLAALASQMGRVWSYSDLAAGVWGVAYTGRPQAIVSAVKRLRRRLEGVGGVGIETVRGVGYRLVPADRERRG